uniref:Uncharacterized protein n=1 Tax=Utricularia reniformis TaxID=192314 RepID=A0A1Y0AZJ0_9LAMI|nr:hypothetical protein AEK19_MT0322 [Utricularia reniformis]ART30595.1 hypothetical protein AEK19_MT0322 [Utricularia reniformis]
MQRLCQQRKGVYVVKKQSFDSFLKSGFPLVIPLIDSEGILSTSFHQAVLPGGEASNSMPLYGVALLFLFPFY